ncbi:MAG TPA: zf-HC2 domain-containing protein [Bryobacteraceae bacterium]|nr:zf-HC2 domain-containing protein [Bryobacteraceae bacterium]
MHAVVMQSLEEFLSGTLNPAAQRDIQAHLKSCETCRGEIRSMQEVSEFFGSLRPEEPVAPAPGFYVRVMQQVEQQKAVATLGNLFGLDPAFGRRLVFACLLTLAVLGSYLVSRETAYQGGPSPEAIMAQQESPAFDSGAAPDNMLVTLTAYDH